MHDSAVMLAMITFLIIAHLSATEELISSSASRYILIINAAPWQSSILDIGN